MVATASKTPTLKPEHLPISSEEKLLIDLSVPRNIDPKLDKMDGIRLIDMDKLKEVADQTLAQDERTSQKHELSSTYTKWNLKTGTNCTT